MNIYLVRHGHAKHNQEKKFVGSRDEDLTEKGLLQIDKLREYFEEVNFDEIYISQRKRTYETAHIIKPHDKYTVDKRLNEANFGIFENKTYEEIERLYPRESKRWEENWKEYKIPEGDSLEELFDRVREFISELEKKKCENILIVSHGGIIKLFYCAILMNNLNLYWNFSCHNGQVSLLKYEYGNWYIDEIVKNEDLK